MKSPVRFMARGLAEGGDDEKGTFVIASEAKQSSAARAEGLDCFVARAPRNDGAIPHDEGGEPDGNGGGGTRRRGSRHAPAFRPAIIQ